MQELYNNGAGNYYDIEAVDPIYGETYTIKYNSQRTNYCATSYLNWLAKNLTYDYELGWSTEKINEKIKELDGECKKHMLSAFIIAGCIVCFAGWFACYFSLRRYRSTRDSEENIE